MSTDRELLELAAKAAGIAHTGYFELLGIEPALRFPSCHSGLWAPLTDDGDAIRLAVQLKLAIEFHQDNGGAVSAINYDLCRSSNMRLQGAGVDFNEDEFAATRRAIVRAAAEIGKAKEDK